MTQDQETQQMDVPDTTSGDSPVAGEDPGMSRILRRETHSSRAGAAVIAAVLVIVLCVYALLEAGVRAIGQPPWLIDPTTAAPRIIALPEGISPLLLGASGAVIAMVGLFFLLHAVLPGRRARHLLRDARTAVVVDDEVLASALARRARTAANVTQEQVMVVVSRQLVVVNVRPTSGSRVSEEAVLAAVQAELEEMSPVPMPAVRVNLASSGVIGA
ncbi:DUF6286 domain-containing protein [Arthrobacter sp. cf158]|uniref:DUF6286 domain-containing protein n=1 Tax=Arthrobacter sp. cf158 TaxID=1761744 RepID=UPI000B891EDD|nr:DUF6286 domain-containing protein [Arthrobacter sp. cf158]